MCQYFDTNKPAPLSQGQLTVHTQLHSISNHMLVRLSCQLSTTVANWASITYPACCVGCGQG